MSFVARVYAKIYNLFLNLGIGVWDVFITLLNLVLPKRAIGHVTPEGQPGYAGVWPEFKPAKPGDSRCSCPALNAMANHGKLPLLLLLVNPRRARPRNKIIVES